MAASQTRPTIGVTMGDPAGIGPEIVAKLWADPSVHELARLVAIGDVGDMSRALEMTQTHGRVHAMESVAQALFDTHAVDVVQSGAPGGKEVALGRIQIAAGRAAYEAVVKGAELALGGDIDAIVTAPLNKAALHLAGYHYDGHTGLLKALTDAQNVAMMLVAGEFRVSHVSTHCSLREAIERATRDRIVQVAELTHSALVQLGIAHPRLAIAGLNPHAGEGGLFGDEEIREIEPAIQALRRKGYHVHAAVVSPDTVFHRMASARAFDAVVAMYHDQGHIPTKLLGFAEGVNVTLGLPIVRTSVDHGTAFDIAGQGIADPTSLKRALEVAIALCRGS